MSAMVMSQEQTYTAEEVAAILRVHVRTVHRMIKRGRLQAFTINRDYRIPKSALDDLMYGHKPKQDEDQQP